MKNLFNPSRKTAVTIMLFAFLIIISSCSSRESNQNTENSVSTSNKNKAPNIDIHTAVLTDNEEAVQQHILAGSNLNEKEAYGGSSPLITASVFGKTAMAAKLIEAGANLNYINNDGSTALHTAAFFCRPEIVDMLIEKGADKTIKNKYGVTAYESVITPFDEVKGAYDMMGQMLSPMGLKLDYDYIRKTRPEIAAKLK